MIIFPAIDLYEKKAVRLYKGDYSQMTLYGDDPVSVALAMQRKGAAHLHLVDLEGARDSGTPNFDIVCQIKQNTCMFCEIGGGIRSIKTITKYINAGIDRVILGTAAVENESLVKQSVAEFGDKIAVGIDIKNGSVAVRGWLKDSGVAADELFDKMISCGVKTIICTDVSKDGAQEGASLGLYSRLSKKYPVNITASGGVTTLGDIRALSDCGLYGAIIGKAYYTGTIDLAEAISEAK